MTPLGTAIPSPASPSFPSEHAAVAGAAQTVLAYLFPDDADALGQRATEAAQSRVEAGVQFPSDIAVGLDLGHKVGELVVQRGRQDGSAVAWDGQFSTIPGAWSLEGYPDGATPVAPTFGTLQPWVLESGKQLRPGPPPAPRACGQASLSGATSTRAWRSDGQSATWLPPARSATVRKRLERQPVGQREQEQTGPAATEAMDEPAIRKAPEPYSAACKGSRVG